MISEVAAVDYDNKSAGSQDKLIGYRDRTFKSTF